MPDFTVIQAGTDTSGRAIFMTRYMAAWWERVCDELGFRPTIVQGAFMARAGGGASASAGYHDLGGCLDLRVWDRTADEVSRIIHVTRSLGAAAWVRDAAHGGFDPHIHLLLGSDRPLASGAAFQWQQYIDGRNGLSDNGPDYHWRPSPLVLTPPEQEYLMTSDAEKKLDALIARSTRIEDKLDVSNANQRERDKRIAARLAKRLGIAEDRILAEFVDEA